MDAGQIGPPDEAQTPEIIDLRLRLDRRLSEMRTDRAVAEPDWHLLTRYILPQRGRYIVQTTSKRPKASSSRILDPCATKAHSQLAAFCMAGITNALAAVVSPRREPTTRYRGR